MSCLGPLAGLEKQRAIYERTVRTLGDPAATTLLLVSRPQPAALREAQRTSGELRALGMSMIPCTNAQRFAQATAMYESAAVQRSNASPAKEIPDSYEAP